MVCVTFVTLECVRARVWAFAISSECRSVCVALVAGAGRLYIFRVYSDYNTRWQALSGQNARESQGAS